MNQLTHNFAQKIRHDDEITEYDFAEMCGGLLVSISEGHDGNDNLTEVFSVEVVGFHIASNVCLTRDQMVQLTCKSDVEHIETVQLEARQMLIG